MDKATKVAVEKYPHGIFDGPRADSIRTACAVGYMQAEKETIERALDYFVSHLHMRQDEKDEWLYDFRKAMEEE